MKIREVNAYSCRYRNTYSIVIVAEDATEARELFTAWLEEQHGEENVSVWNGDVRRLHIGGARPVFAAARQFDPGAEELANCDRY